jgi:type II secretory pathway predicted ATPase ExeA
VPLQFSNPFRPGAGHTPPYLAGRDDEKREFLQILKQDVITQNPIITGLRGVGKTVLLESLKEQAITGDWWWVGTDLSESASLTEERIALRLLADLSVVSSQLVVAREVVPQVGFKAEDDTVDVRLDFRALKSLYDGTPGLVVDKLKVVLETTSAHLPTDVRGIVFAYDEAQHLADHAEDKEYPLSLVLDLFQSLQRRGLRTMLVLVGLPTIFPKAVEARTWAERMFHVIQLGRLSDDESREAIRKPIEKTGCPVKLSDDLVGQIVRESGGYPYFIQFIAREVYDVALQKSEKGEPLAVSIADISRKLDADFFSARWARITDRQRDLLRTVAELGADEFTVQQVVVRSKELAGSHEIAGAFSASHANQILAKLIDAGFVYKDRHGCYLFAVPLMGRFILRQARM